MQRILVISVILAATLVFGACAPAPTIDEPSLSSQEAMAIAKQHSVTSPLNRDEALASRYALLGGTQGWNAIYSGNGKWTVELHLRNEDESITIHRWSVFETSLAAVYLGAYKRN